MKICQLCPTPVFSGGFCKRHYGFSQKGKEAVLKRYRQRSFFTGKGAASGRSAGGGAEKRQKTAFQAAVTDADTWFSRYVRLLFMRENGVVQCVTHSSRHGFFHIKRIQCGHFQVRKHYATRWTLENCGPQCAGCNKFKQGEQVKMGEWLDLKYGPGTAERMRTKAIIGRKINEFEVRQIAEYWKGEFTKLSAEKGNPWK